MLSEILFNIENVLLASVFVVPVLAIIALLVKAYISIWKSLT